MNIKRIIVLFFLIQNCILLFSQTNINQIRSMLWVQETIQKDIDNIIKPVLSNALTDKERIVSKNISIIVVPDERIGRVRAFNENSKKKIEISTGFIALMANLIEADIISANLGYLDEIADYYILVSDYLKDYNKYLTTGEILSEPEPFFEFIKMAEDDYLQFIQTDEYDYIFSMNMRILLSYIIAHEYAHHILGHLTIKEANSIEESRENEDEADDFSIRVNWMLNNNPLVVARYFMLFTAIEEIPHNYKHTASACRLEKFLHAGIKFTEPLIKNETDIAYLEQLKKGRNILLDLCEKGDLMPIPLEKIPGLW